MTRAAPADAFAAIGAAGFDLTRDRGGASFLRGWSTPEEPGRWTDGDTAILALRVPGARAGDRPALRIHLTPYLPANAPEITARAWAGAEVARWSFTPGVQDAGHRSLRAALRAHGADAVLVLAMRFDGLLSREERAGRSADHRALGILLQRIEIVFPEAIPTLDRPLPLNGSESDTLAFGGWGHAEADGRWTIAREAHLQFQLPPAAERRPRAVRLLMPRSFSADGRSRQVDVVINGMTISRLVVPAPQAATGPGILAGGTYDVALPDHVRAGAVIDVRLRVDAPASPRSIGLSDDGRELGIFLGAVIPVD